MRVSVSRNSLGLAETRPDSSTPPPPIFHSFGSQLNPFFFLYADGVIIGYECCRRPVRQTVAKLVEMFYQSMSVCMGAEVCVCVSRIIQSRVIEIFFYSQCRLASSHWWHCHIKALRLHWPYMHARPVWASEVMGWYYWGTKRMKTSAWSIEGRWNEIFMTSLIISCDCMIWGVRWMLIGSLLDSSISVAPSSKGREDS